MNNFTRFWVGAIALAMAWVAYAEISDAWFDENAQTFKLDIAQERWKHAEGVASVELGRIAVKDLTEDETISDKELRYVPEDPKASDAYLVGEMTVSFNEVGSMDLKSDGGFAGVQLVDAGTEYNAVFAVLNPTRGDAAWLATDVPGEIGKDYVIRYEVGKMSGFYGRCVRYFYREANESEFKELATAGIAEDTARLGEVAFVGGGTITEMAFGFKSGDENSLTMDVDDVRVDYGVDFTNATVRFQVKNYWKGANYEGQALAELVVRDVEGRVIDTTGAGGVLVGSNGVYEIANVCLPSGGGCDYRFEVCVYAHDELINEDTIIEYFDRNCSGARVAGTWFGEDAETFAAGGKDGTWSYDAGAAFVAEGMIGILTGEPGNAVKFTPNREVTQGIAKFENDVIFDAEKSLEIGYGTAEMRIAGLTLIAGEGEDEGKYFFAVWKSAINGEGGEFVKTSCSVDPVPGMKYRLGWSINYETGYVSYSCNGEALLSNDVTGQASFEIPAMASAGSVSYLGKGRVNALQGDEYNANVAATVIGGVTNEYDTVDAAVAAAKGKEGAEIAMLWDATWRPLAEEVGRTVQFTGEHKVYVDPSTEAQFAQQGYRVVDNGDGSLTIGVVNYFLKFAINGDGGVGEMEDQAYSVTNMVFAIASNRFEREGWTFTRWSTDQKGYAASWEDGATIDMTQYGLTNMTLFAQWKVAVRTIVIEAADEFVYIERITTNGVENTGVRYFCEDPKKATGRAVVSVDNGSSFLVEFSTDLEKALTFNQLVKRLDEDEIYADDSIPYASQPKVYIEGYNEILTPLQAWAVTKGISLTALKASRYANASFKLDADKLLTDSSRVEIFDVKMLERGMSFKIRVDGKQVTDVNSLAGMVKTANSVDTPAEAWDTVPTDAMSVGGEGEIMVTTEGEGESTKFMKIVIPSGN